MSETRITAYADALTSIGRAEGVSADMEDELFRFSRALEGNDELHSVLSDPHIPAARRQQIVEDLLGAKATAATVASVSLLVGAGRIGDLSKIVDEVVARGASNRGEQVAEVRSAVALTAEQQARLVAALQARTNVQITVRNIVDPTVLGGVVTTIGDSVLDGSIRTRLTQLRDAF
jgi:F-type H+-transporting ATPase subunit delta